MIPTPARQGWSRCGGRLANAVIALGGPASLVALLGVNLERWPWWGLIAALALRTQLQTGLFILAHDAMHGILWPGRRRWNDACGAAALALYGALPYRACRANHRRHHRAPATARDPDFPSAARSGALAGALGWYRQFMAGYLSVPQMARLLAFWGVLAACFSSFTPTAALNVLLFCTAPLLLSSLQLFTFGTYLPHRAQRPPDSALHPGSLDLPTWLSLLACFHFGYHREHHDCPGLAWHQLPAARQRGLRLAATGQPR